MKYDRLMELVESDSFQLVLSVPGLIIAAGKPTLAYLSMDKDLAIGIINGVVNALGTEDLELDDLEFQVAFSGDQLILLLDSTWPKTVN